MVKLYYKKKNKEEYVNVSYLSLLKIFILISLGELAIYGFVFLWLTMMSLLI